MDLLKFVSENFEPTARTLDDMRTVIFDRDWLKTANNFTVYSFFRDIYLEEDHRKIMKKHGIQFDLTVIPAGRLGVEFVKTKGHYHPKKPGTKLSYPEIYEVLEGEAHYIFQKEEDGVLEDVVMIRAAKGDKVIIPPGYGHITINTSDKTLKLANLVSSSFSSDYKSIEKKGGGAYFMLVNGLIIPNKRYGPVPVLRVAKPPDLSRQGIRKDDTLYSLIHRPQVLKFLTHPENNSDLFLNLLNE